jgi:hypothetical protein
MSKETVVFQIFVASPSDVEDEREILTSVIAELNRTWSNSLGLTLELLKWETHVHPSFSSDPQAVINEQITPDYDAFIGIFWSRIGTSTPRAQSGSLEEFERAYSKWKVNNKSPEIMIYFKDEAIPPSKIDSRQLELVQEFKKTVGNIGGIYSQFEDKSAFESSVRVHLSAIAQNFAENKYLFIPASKLKQKNSKKQEITIIDDGYGYGYLDYWNIFKTQIEKLSGSYKLNRKASDEFIEMFISKHSELVLNWTDPITKKNVNLGFIDSLDAYAENLNTQNLICAKARKKALNALSKLLSLGFDEKGDKLDYVKYKNLLLRIVKTSFDFQNQIIRMKSALYEYQKDNLVILNAKQDAIFQLDIFLTEIKNATSNYENIIEAIDKF